MSFKCYSFIEHSQSTLPTWFFKSLYNSFVLLYLFSCNIESQPTILIWWTNFRVAERVHWPTPLYGSSCVYVHPGLTCLLLAYSHYRQGWIFSVHHTTQSHLRSPKYLMRVVYTSSFSRKTTTTTPLSLVFTLFNVGTKPTSPLHIRHRTNPYTIITTTTQNNSNRICSPWSMT